VSYSSPHVGAVSGPRDGALSSSPSEMSGESSTPQAAAGSSEAPAASTSAGVAAVHAAIPPSDGVTPMELDDATNRATADASAAALLPLPAEAASAAPSAGDFPQLDEDEPMAPADFLAADSQARSQTKAATSSSQHAAAANASIAGVSTLAAPSPSSGAAVASSSSSSPPDPSSLVPAAFSRLVHSALSSLQRSEQSARIAVERAHEVQEHTWALLQGRKVECGCMSESVPVTMIASAPGHTPKHETKQQEHFHPTVSTLPKPPAAAVALDTLVETIEGCVAISALQAYLVASSSESMWTISVQLRNIATHTLDGLKISLAPSRTVGGARVQPFSLLAFTSSISLPSGESICLSARFPSGGNLPHAMREVPIGVQVTWREARKVSSDTENE
jgi:hypothetical protein